MCGICGKVSFGRPVERELVRKMNARLVHRGPDEEGFHVSADGRAGLGIRRLKIIDLETGSQPISNETGDVTVVLNGEIYNYIELREELRKRGHVFSTKSDTEVLVHAYESSGPDFARGLNGMFAFALWDRTKKLLVLGRDRMGIKPLYARRTAEGISFASEIKALLADPDCPREIDPIALDDYFSLLYVPGPRSVFRGIEKLEPGHLWICDAATGQVEVRSFWERPMPAAGNGGAGGRSWEDVSAELDGLFRDALKLQLRSDVPNGLFLSSGLDSAAIACYASAASSARVKSFTVHFRDESYSERDGARLIARACGTEHEEILLEPDVRDLIERTTDFFDEPFADTSAIPTWLLCEFARRKITVALSGEGGDELFAGYPTYLATRWAGRYRKVPRWARALVARGAGALPVSWERVSWDYKLKQFVYGAEYPPERSHFAWKEIFSEGEKRSLYSPDFLAARDGHDGFESFRAAFAKAGGGTDLERLLFVDQNTYLLDQFLVKSDRMSMAHSLEVRVPILDHRIVEAAARVPERYKLRGFTTKWTLRKLLEGRIPDSILSAPKKGFSPPVPNWIAGVLRPFFEEVLSGDSVRKAGFLDPAHVRRLLDEHLAKKRDNHRRLWAVMNFILWKRKWAP